MNLEIVERNSRKFVRVPIGQYNQVLEELEMLEDIRNFEEAKAIAEALEPDVYLIAS